MKCKKLLLLVSLIPLVSCSKNTMIESRVFYFDTLVDIKLYDGKQSDLKEIKQLLQSVDEVADAYHQRTVNNVYSINQTNERVTVNETLYNLLFTAYNVNQECATYFNPLCGSLSELWKNSLANNELPSDEAISNELYKIANSSLSLSSGQYVQRIGDATIDLGGIAKGYALDLVKNYLTNTNKKQYLVNAGSSSILLGEKNEDNGYFTIGLSDLPKSYLKLKDCFVSTSSKSVQGVTIDGVKYSHIVNPTNGSAINLNDAVIVISNKGYLGDALSTSMMMNTVEEIQNIENLIGVQTIVIRNGQKVYSHPDIKVYNR